MIAQDLDVQHEGLEQGEEYEIFILPVLVTRRIRAG